MALKTSVNDSILVRLTSMEDATGLLKDSIAKSLRSYRTKLHPLLRERLAMLGELRDDISDISETTSYTFARTNEGLTGAKLSNFIMQSFFDHEEPEYLQIIYPRCSKKTAGPPGYRKLTMGEYIRDKVKLLSPTYGGVCDFRVLSTQELGRSVVNDILQDDYSKSSLSVAINCFLEENDYCFPATNYLRVPGRDIPPLLEMDSKFYPTRNDDRAFCKDRLLLRHLSGCCLHQLFHPKSINTRQNLSRNSVVPAFGKDKLNFTLPRAPRKIARLIISDISNFTGSNGNSWAMLHACALQLTKGGTWEKAHNLFCIGGSFVKATWRDLLIIYLYTTVGIPCTIPGTDELGYLPGGFLGVAANITVGIVMLAVVLENLKRILRGKLDYVYAQAGGDDNVFGLFGEESDVEEATKTIHRHLENYVGHIKEFHVIDLENVNEGVLEYTYCKKTIVLTRRKTSYEITTLPTIPIPECLSTNGYLSDLDYQRKAWRSLHLDLQRWEIEHPEPAPEIADTIRQRFLDIYPTLAPARFTTGARHLTTTARWEVRGGIKVSRKALATIESYPDVELGDNLYLSSFQERLRHALTLGHCLRATALLGNLVCEIVVHEKDKRFFRVESLTQFVGLTPDTELLDQINSLYNKFN